jgi:hypothetical protein
VRWGSDHAPGREKQRIREEIHDGFDCGAALRGVDAAADDRLRRVPESFALVLVRATLFLVQILLILYMIWGLLH